LLRDHLPGAIGVIGEGSERVLDRPQGLVPHSVQFSDNLAPVGGSTPKAMHKYDCWFAGHARFAFRGLGNFVVSRFAFGGAAGAVEQQPFSALLNLGARPPAILKIPAGQAAHDLAAA